MEKAFVIGDIHGCYEELLDLLQYWKKDEEQLIFLGDYIDRGPDSLKVVRHVQNLYENNDAIALKGNHEDMLSEWLQGENEARYLRNGGEETLDSFIKASEHFTEGSYEQFRTTMIEEFSSELRFLSNRPQYYEWHGFLFVHAGVDLTRDWKSGTKEDYLWIREPFHTGKNHTGKRIVFGHTPVKILNADRSFNPWFSDCGTKIGIDGGLVFGGQLNGLKVEANGNSDWLRVEKK